MNAPDPISNVFLVPLAMILVYATAALGWFAL